MTALPPLETLYRRFRREALAVARRVLHDADESEDVVQELFLKLSTRPDGFRGQATARTWLKAVVLNASINAARSRKRRAALQLPPAEVEPPDEASMRLQHRAALARAIESLPPRQREVLAARELRGQSYQAIAARLGLPLGTVKSLLNRGRARVLQRLARADGSPRAEVR